MEKSSSSCSSRVEEAEVITGAVGGGGTAVIARFNVPGPAKEDVTIASVSPGSPMNVMARRLLPGRDAEGYQH